MGGIERSDEDGMVISSLSSIPISLEVFSTTGEAFGARGTEGESARVGVCCADGSGDDVNAGASGDVEPSNSGFGVGEDGSPAEVYSSRDCSEVCCIISPSGSSTAMGPGVSSTLIDRPRRGVESSILFKLDAVGSVDRRSLRTLGS